jgi:hypothetical protein
VTGDATDRATTSREELLRRYAEFRVRTAGLREEIRAIKEANAQQLGKMLALERQIARGDCCGNDECAATEPPQEEDPPPHGV